MVAVEQKEMLLNEEKKYTIGTTSAQLHGTTWGFKARSVLQTVFIVAVYDLVTWEIENVCASSIFVILQEGESVLWPQ